MKRFKLPFKLPSFPLLIDFVAFIIFLRSYTRNRGYSWFSRFENLKDVLVDVLYKKRGRYARPFLHFGTIGLIFLMVTFGPMVFKDKEAEVSGVSGPVLRTATAYAPDFYTLQAEEVRQYRGGDIIIHTVAEGETVSSIAERYGLQADTILWENNLTAKDKIKPGQELRILPIDGVRHKVARGETIYTIGKKYGLEGSQTQMIVDYPFNEFLNDETFELVVGQFLLIPEGVKPEEVIEKPRVPVAKYTADAGAVSATGSFIWPASGTITQGYRFYHKAIDIANRGAGPILAADSGVVTVAGWVDNSGYGNRVVIDHGNGYVTLYAHLSVIQVKVGQRVNRGDVLGQMGNTGRSTGTHLHFEIRNGGSLMNPQSYLK
ncbi:MAG: peptidoglycan DD-metalloendopeptidase family protein [Patescibacteria group bacterium]